VLFRSKLGGVAITLRLPSSTFTEPFESSFFSRQPTSFFCLSERQVFVLNNSIFSTYYPFKVTSSTLHSWAIQRFVKYHTFTLPADGRVYPMSPLLQFDRTSSPIQGFFETIPFEGTRRRAEGGGGEERNDSGSTESSSNLFEGPTKYV